MIDITVHVYTVFTVFATVQSNLVQTKKIAFVERQVSPTLISKIPLIG